MKKEMQKLRNHRTPWISGLPCNEREVPQMWREGALGTGMLCCPSAYRRQERTRKGSTGARDQKEGREDPAVRKRERSESVVTSEQRKPQRPDRVTTPPRIQERAKEASSLEDSLTVVYDRKTPVVMTTQEYVGRSHPSLPICQIREQPTNRW